MSFGPFNGAYNGHAEVRGKGVENTWKEQRQSQKIEAFFGANDSRLDLQRAFNTLAPCKWPVVTRVVRTLFDDVPPPFPGRIYMLIRVVILHGSYLPRYGVSLRAFVVYPAISVVLQILIAISDMTICPWCAVVS